LVFSELIQKIRRVFSLGVLSRTRVNNKVKFLQVQMGDEFSLDDVEHLESFGFTSKALAGADVVLMSEGGNRGKPVCIMTADRKYRIEIAEGETAIYNQHGDKVHLKADRTIECVTPVKVLLSTPLVECQEDLTVHGNVQVDGDSNIDGNNTVGGDETVTGAVTAASSSLSGNLTAAGATIGGKDFSTHRHRYDGNSTTEGVS